MAEIARHIRPGIATEKLDQIAETFLKDHGAIPSFKGYRGFPASLCISTNDQVVHGLPGSTELKEGDIISIDCGAFKNGYHGDSAYTFTVGEVKEEILRLMQVTKEALYLGIEKAVAGQRLGDISFAIQEHAERKHGYGIVRELVGHGVGKDLHEDPEVPNHGKRGTGTKLKEGLVIAIEPMVNLGTKEVAQGEDGWTVFTEDRQPSAHYEHTVVVRKGKAELLSDHQIIEEAIKENSAIQEVV